MLLGTIKYKVGYVLLCFTFVCGGVLAHAQVVHAQQMDSMLDLERPRASLELSPQHPRPGQVVTATVKQYVFDSDFSLITWKNNGNVVHQGYGETTYEFIAGGVGSLINLEAAISNRDGFTVTAKKSLRISDISFIWEARTYTPPFFMGRPKFSYGAAVAIVAHPLIFNTEGELYDVSELTFTWMQGLKKVHSARGINSFVARPDTPFDSLQVTVLVSDPTGAERMSYYIQLAPSPSRLLFYEDNPLLGVLYRTALPESFDLSGEELKLVAEPLYSTAQSRADPSLSYTWTVNDSVYPFPGSIVLRPESGLSGTTEVSLIVLNNNNYLERLQKSASVRYSAVGADDGVWTDTETNPL
jgi:hypothetical protein